MCSNDTRPVETVAEKRYFQSVLAQRDGVSMKLGIISIRQIGGKRVGVRYVWNLIWCLKVSSKWMAVAKTTKNKSEREKKTSIFPPPGSNWAWKMCLGSAAAEQELFFLRHKKLVLHTSSWAERKACCGKPLYDAFNMVRHVPHAWGKIKWNRWHVLVKSFKSNDVMKRACKVQIVCQMVDDNSFT